MATVVDEPANRIGLVSRSTVALAYLVLGALGLSLAIPPGFASPVFPAAGFALACALLYGRQVLPSIWLGSIALNVGQMAVSGTLAPVPVLTAGVVAAGAALQAALGAWYIDRHGLRDWRTLASEKAVIRFLWIGGALACLVSASISVTALRLAGVVKPDAWLFSWWNWYTGDLIGVVIFAPLTMLALRGRDPLWRERRWRVGVPIVVTLMLAMAAFGVAMRWEKQQEQARLSRDGESLARLIRSRLIAHEEILSSLRRFAEATPGFTYRQFEVFTRISLADNPDIFALSFNDLVRGDDLAAHERRVKGLSPVAGYRVTERNERGELVPVQPRDFHVAVRYIIPLQGNLPAAGYDINSDPLRREAIERAREKNGMAVTAPLRLVQENAVRMGVLALQPVHAKADDSAQETGRPIGFAVAVVKVDELIGIATRGNVPPGLVLSVKDASAPAGADTFHVSGDAVPGDVGGMWETPLTFGGREWRLEVRAQQAYLATRRPWMAWAVGVVGLMFSGLLQVYLLGMTGRTSTIRRQNEALLANQAGLQLADAVFKNAGEAVMVIDRDGAIVSVNPAFTSITGYGAQEAQGQPLRMLAGGDVPTQVEQLEQSIWQALAERGQWRGERPHQRKDGSAFLAWWTITAIKGDTSAASLYVCTFSDITEQRNAQERVEFLAYHDALTSLPNRVLGRQRALEAIAHARRHGLKLAVLFLDLDHFKLVNDTYGHSVGDQLLQQVASRLRANLRAADCLCRLSGDEFMVILEDVQQSAQVVQVCEKLLAQIAKPFELDGRFVQVSVTIGLALFPVDGEDPETLLRHADTALFEAKQAGRNTYRMFDAYMNADVVRFVTIRDELQQALKNGEFELYFQPQVDLADGSVHAVEALIRWDSPSRGLVMPGDFISVAEESGLIAPIGEWVLQQACRQMAEWRARGVHLATVAVNLSAVQLRKPGLAQVLAQSLAQTGLPAGCLELELTESILIQDRANTLVKLEELLAYGVRLSIDDFGTGYSSMAYLKRLKVHKLKIDRSFAADVANDREDAAIVTAIVTMAHSLGLQTVAEGIESPEAEAVLRAMGCDQVQGFLHAKPMPAAQFEAWYERRRAAGVAAPETEPT